MAVAYAQTPATSSTGYVQSSTISTANAVTAGSLLLLFIGTSSGSADNITSVTDNRGNTWTKLVSTLGGGRTADIWYAKNAAAGATQVTIASTDYITRSIVLSEFSGVDQSGVPISTNRSAAAFSSSAAVSGSITAVSGYPFYLAYAVADAPTISYTGSNGITTDATSTGGSGTAEYTSAAIGTKNTTATGTVTGGFTLSNPQNGVIGFIALKEGTTLPTKNQTGNARISRVNTTRAQQLRSVTASWFNRYMRADGAIVRPTAEGNNDYPNYAASQDAVSEGQAYAQIFALQVMNDQALFDRIENWNYNNLDRRNYVNGAAGINAPTEAFNIMAYHYNTSSNAVYDWSGAYDADVDRAKALIWAHIKWGSGGTINYISRARAIIKDLDDYGLRMSSSTNLLYLVSGTGLNMTSSAPEMNNSYQDPAAFRLFATWASYANSNSRWNSAVNGAYDILEKTANAVLSNPVAPGNNQMTSAKLPANWVTMNFNTGVVSALSTTYRDTNFTYDAFRQIHRLRYDKKFYSEARAETRLSDIRMFYADQYNTTMPNVIQAEYFHDGNVKSAYQANIFYWTAVLDLAGDTLYTTLYNTIRDGKFINNADYFEASTTDPNGTFYDNSPQALNDVGYYGQSWLIFAEMDDQNTFVNYGQSASKDQLGNARITVATQRLQTANSRITAATQRTQLGNARLTAVVARTTTGNARVTAVTTQNQLGNARITATTLRTTTANSRITATTLKTQTANARLTAVTQRNQIGNTNIQSATTTTQRAQTANARIQAVTNQTTAGNSRITVSTQQNTIGTARITVTQPPNRVNLVGNPSFETDLSGWGQYGGNPAGTLDRVALYPYSGSYSARVINGAANSGGGYAGGMSQAFSLVNGVQYTVSAWIYAVAPQNIGWYVGQSGNPSADISIPAGWSRHTLTFVATSTFPTFYLRSNTVNATWYADAIQLEQGSTATPYFEGSAPSGQYGTARIQVVTARNQPGNANIFNTTQRNQTGNTTIISAKNQNQNGTARITAPSTQNQTGTARIQNINYGDNLIDNGMFDNLPAGSAEQTNNGWYNGTATGDASDNGYHWKVDGGNNKLTSLLPTAFYGKGAMRIRTTAGGLVVENRHRASGYGTSQTEGVAIKPNTRYRLSYWVKAENASGDNSSSGAYLQFLTVNGSSGGVGEYGTSSSGQKTNTDWIYKEVIFTTAATAARGHLEARLYAQGAPSTLQGDFYFAQIMLQEVGGNQIGTARIQQTVTPNQLGNARIQAVINRDATGNARIAATTTRDQVGNGRVVTSGSRDQIGNARITAVPQRTQIGNARITAVTTTVQTGNARIQQTVNRDQLANARIQLVTQQAQNGNARVQKTVAATQTGNARIVATTAQAQTGNARIIVNGTTNQNQTGNARISATTQQTQPGNATIAVTTLRTVLGNARIQSVPVRDQIGRASILATTQRAQTGSASLAAQVNRDQTGSARIVSGFDVRTKPAGYVAEERPRGFVSEPRPMMVDGGQIKPNGF